ncbi:hypothetical protein FALBO_12442 [Fusarium albosuccineum]|uniref:Uncharacterized protein n=1 Tax=Fusarium albosuccineum TaxID=1237068 RepID=A0A8H4PH60_9HYPO|nr:hypothetical protein FALBO_12442 [Fusarium albosuccineum]
MGSDDSLAGTWSALKEDFSCPLAGVAGSVSSSWDQSPGHGGLVVRGGCRAVSVLAGVWATSLTAVAKEVICRREVGIVTVITSAIRVQGMQVAKAFIGRARENRALAEIELMSSTSGEVCELFNGNSIVRAMALETIQKETKSKSPQNERPKDETPQSTAPEDTEPKGTESKDQTPQSAEPKDTEPKDYLFCCLPIKSRAPTVQKEPKDQTPQSTEAKDAETKDTETEDTSCGIHNLETATSRNTGQSKLIECQPYSSYSATNTRECWKSALKFFREIWGHRLDDEEKGQQSDTAGSASTGLPLEAKPALDNPPNLQLNLSSNHFDSRKLRKRHEIFLAAIAGVLLQTGLIAIAAVAAYHLNPKPSSLFESKAYGFPCYAAGSVLLSLGTGAVNCAKENTDGEKMTTVEKSLKSRENAPRLIWLQQCQTVNDQSFKSYAILAGPKRRVITSRRGDDVKRHQQSQDPTSKDDSGSSEDKKTQAFLFLSRCFKTVQDALSTQSQGFWEWLTVGAALLAGLGFTAQFMGLRGLSFPCSIAQLGAIFIMALIRAGIRRRLGKVPAHCPALDRYELDFLAAHIVFYPQVRNFYQCKSGEENYGGDMVPSEFCRWKVRAPVPHESGPSFVRSGPSRQKGQVRGAPKLKKQTSTPNSDQQHSDSPNGARAGPTFKAASSQQLLRVRERLGNLCNCTSQSLESARSLAQSIQFFMDVFFPSPSSLELEHKNEEPGMPLKWLIEVTKLTSDGVSEKPDVIQIPVVRRKSTGKWEVDIGKIDAVLSLWMASFEAQRSRDADNAKRRKEAQQDVGKSKIPSNQRQPAREPSPDWRRTKAGDDLRYTFGRIIGDNLEDQVLKRDISWWVESLVAEQSDPERGVTNNSDEDGSNTEDNGRRWSKARSGDVDLVIGFNSNEPHNAAAQELGITSKACLSTILAQHLFTNFMWTVAKCLPKDCLSPSIDGINQEVEIEGPPMFESRNFTQTWFRLKLRHRQLTKVVRQIELYGLGSTTELLLCIIPPLSFMRLLPNQMILKLMPSVASGQDWVETAACYNKLLDMINTTKVDQSDKFGVFVIIKTMDFLSFAYEPYDEYTGPPEDLHQELDTMVENLVSSRFSTVMEKLAPFYGLQCREELFKNIFLQFSDSKETKECAERLKNFCDKVDFDFAKSTLGFTEQQCSIISPIDEALNPDQTASFNAEDLDTSG